MKNYCFYSVAQAGINRWGGRLLPTDGLQKPYKQSSYLTFPTFSECKVTIIFLYGKYFAENLFEFQVIRAKRQDGSANIQNSMKQRMRNMPKSRLYFPTIGLHASMTLQTRATAWVLTNNRHEPASKSACPPSIITPYPHYAPDATDGMNGDNESCHYPHC